MRDFKILIGGDLVVTKNCNPKLDSRIESLFKESDFNILNLECPITEATDRDKISKTGPHLKGDGKKIMDVAKKLSIDLFTLANNHLRDYGNKGVLETLDFCKRINVNFVGAGKRQSSVKTAVEHSDGKLKVLNYAENEWGNAQGDLAGSSNYNLVDIYNDIKNAKKSGFFVLLIIHGGNEYYNLPSPERRKEYRFLANAGADMIVSHHTHCYSGMEMYNGTPIFYGLGNFLFTIPSKYQVWYTGILVEIILNEGKLKSWRIIPVSQEVDNFDLSLLGETEEIDVINSIKNLSHIITDDKMLNEEWEKFVSRRSKSYLANYSLISFISNSYIRAVLNKLRMSRVFSSKRHLKIVLNLMRCEAHSELSQKIITKHLQNDVSNSRI